MSCRYLHVYAIAQRVVAILAQHASFAARADQRLVMAGLQHAALDRDIRPSTLDGLGNRRSIVQTSYDRSAVTIEK